MSTLDEMMNEPGADDEMAKRKAMLGPPQGDNEEYVDRIEGDTAVLICKGENGPETREVKVSDLPRGTKEGDTVPSDSVGGKASLYGGDGSGGMDKASIINSLYGARFPR